MKKASVQIDTIQVKASSYYMFVRQAQHWMLMFVLLVGGWSLAIPTLDGSTWLGISDRNWLLVGLLAPVIQQILAWFVFRSQLCFQLLTRILGKADLVLWGIVFFPLLAARPLSLIGLAISDQGSLNLPSIISWGLGIFLLIPALYALWSVLKYFGVARALGGDHFRERYRQMPFVRQGAFRWNPNAMYVYVFLLLWSIALIGNSRSALAVALFQHAYIWVHMYCTEEPDMQLLYGNEPRS